MSNQCHRLSTGPHWGGCNHQQDHQDMVLINQFRRHNEHEICMSKTRVAPYLPTT